MEQQLGHYKIIELIGRGGMGSVYKAHEMSLNRIVALKVLGEHLTEDETNISRFRREARSVAALNHPNVIQIYFIGEDKGHHFFVMEFVDGVTLKDLICRAERPKVKESISLIRQATVGLAAAHDRGLIHRDIKPANIMVNTDGIVKIADFGLAFRPEDQTKLTASGMFLGTPGYLAPEQCTGDPLDPRTDMYALGMTLYELLVGRSAYGEDSLPPLALIHRVMQEDPQDISQANPQVGPDVRVIVNRMISKKREDRYPSCHQLLADLDAVLGPSQAIWRPTSETMPLPAAAPPSVPASPAPTVSNAATEVVSGSSDRAPTLPRPAVHGQPVYAPPVSVKVPEKPKNIFAGKAMIWIGVAAAVLLVATISVIIGLSINSGAKHVTEVMPQKLEPTQTSSGDESGAWVDSEDPYESDQLFIQDEARVDSEATHQNVEPREAKTAVRVVETTSTQVDKAKGGRDIAATNSAPKKVESGTRPTKTQTVTVEKQAKPTVAKAAKLSGVASCLQKLRSPDDAQKRQAAKIIIKRFPKNDQLLDAVKSELLDGYLSKPKDNLHVDTMAWLCRTLSHSGNRRFAPTLKKVAEGTKSKKIKKFAQSGVKRLK